MSFKIDLVGMEDTLNKLRKLDTEISRDVDAEIGASVLDMERSAKQFAPVNDGLLRSSISTSKVDKMTYELVSAAPYSAFMEFGTKKKFDSVTGYEKLAEAAKGKGGGSYKQFLDSLTRWVEKKIGKKNARGIAWVIARSILVNGVKGNHYFTRGIEAHKRKMLDRIKKIVEG